MIDESTIKRWEHEYIDDINLDNRFYLNLNKDEMIKFINDNYFDKSINKYVTGKGFYMIMGLQYIDVDCAFTRGDSIRYLLCVAKNNKGTYTILSDVIYHENCLNVFDEQTLPVTLLEYSEANQYFRNKGLNKDILKEFARTIDHSKMMLTTSQSVLGCKYHVFDTLKEYLQEYGFDKDIRMLSQMDMNYINTLCGKNSLTLKRKDI